MHSEKLQEVSIGCRVSFEWWTGRKTFSKDQKAQVAREFGADQKTISASKRLIDSKREEYADLTALRGEIREFWTARTLPYPEKGIRLLRRDHVAFFADRMNGYKDDLAELARKLDRAWHEITGQAARQLGNLASAEDYPLNIADEFQVTWDFPALNPPEYLRDIAPEVYDRECQRIRAEFSSAVELAEQGFLAELGDMVSRLTERLQPNADGRPKVFRDSMIGNLREFFSRFRGLNIGSSEALATLVAQAESAIASVSPADLRESQFSRERVRAQFSAISDQIAEHITDAPARRIRVESEVSA